jgi:nucleoside-diphosphate-sugar epimerase
MRALVLGATGATGRLLVEQLLLRDLRVRVIVRSAERLAAPVRHHAKLSTTEASLLDLSDAELAEQVAGCDAVASCLGHTLSLKGVFGKPRRLVTEATARICAAIEANQPEQAVRFVLMNTSGNRNPDLPEKRSLGERVVIGLVRALVPPQADNERAAEHLRAVIGHANHCVEWVAVRPDSLIDEDRVSEYSLHPSPIRSPIFDAGKTSRINVAHFMARLITEDETWRRWRGQMPVIYNEAPAAPERLHAERARGQRQGARRR